MRDPLINEAVIAAAEERIAQIGTNRSVQRLREDEPDLYYTISHVGNTVLADMEGVTLEMHEAADRAVWRAALVALESYRLAYYRLWRGTELGGVLERLDPPVSKGPFRPTRRKQERPSGTGPEET